MATRVRTPRQWKEWVAITGRSWSPQFLTFPAAILTPRELDPGRVLSLPDSFEIKGIFAAKGATLNLLGSTGNLKWKNTKEGLTVFISKECRSNLPCDLAWAVKISAVK